jgi:tetratricopeptide (TPR) repeat protein
MTDRILEELRLAVQEKRALIVCGSGVSKAADPARALDWRGLIRSGIEESVDWGFADEKWRTRQLRSLDEGDVEEWIAVADLFTDKLGGHTNEHFARWLDRTVGTLEPRDRGLLDSIIGLQCPIATTNYDDILAKATKRPAVPWIDRPQFVRVMNGDDAGILHLHGHWRRPESVILGTKSYHQLVNDDRSQFLQQFLAFNFSLIFVGCSEDGLSDNNLGRLKLWLEGWDGSGRIHFHLVEDSRLKLNRANTPIKMLSYGNDHRSLPGFLQGLIPSATTVPETDSAETTPLPNATVFQPALHGIENDIAPDECFGRAAELETVITGLIQGRTPIAIGGGPGMGKTTIAVKALYDKRVVEKFGQRRIFVALDSAREPHTILTSLATCLGVTAVGGDAQLLTAIRNACSDAPVAVILDNADTPLSAAAPETKRILRLLAPMDGLAAIITVRGTTPQLGQKIDIPTLSALPHDASKDAFISIAGELFRADPHLDDLLLALDGHPLSITLLSARAKGQSRLIELLTAFKRHRADLLRMPGANREDRLTSTRASLRLSLDNPILSATAKRLFALLALLPAGMSRDDLETLFGDDAFFAKSILNTLCLAYDRGDSRLRVLAPLRDCARLDCRPEKIDETHLLAIMCALARDAAKVDTSSWPSVKNRVIAEADNLDEALIRLLANRVLWSDVAESLIGLAELHRYTGLGAVSVLTAAAKEFANVPVAKANLMRMRGLIALDRSNLDAARLEFAEELHLSSKFGDPGSVADSMGCLGEIALRLADYNLARTHYRGALKIHHEHGQKIGVAECTFRLGLIAVRLSDHQAAVAAMKQALPAFRDAGQTGSAGHCIKTLGDVFLHKMELDSAWKHYEDACDLYRKCGSVVGEANCLLVFGEVGILQKNYESAHDYVISAQKLYRKVGDILGNANCLFNFGEIAFRTSDLASAERFYAAADKEHTARSSFEARAYCEWRRGEIIEFSEGNARATAHFARAIEFKRQALDDFALPGWIELHHAKCAALPEEAASHADKARLLWKEIERLDLIATFIEQGGPTSCRSTLLPSA